MREVSEELSAKCLVVGWEASVCFSPKPSTGQEHQVGNRAVTAFGRTHALGAAVRQISVCL